MKEKHLEVVQKLVTEGKEFPSFRSGDKVRVYFTVREAGKERIQIFEGDVIRRHRNGESSTFTVRKVSFGVGVERTFPLYSPLLTKIEVKEMGRVRRSRLYYLRKLKGRAARIKVTQQGLSKEGGVPSEGLPVGEK